MSDRARRAEFFALEAGEYLGELDAVLGAEGRPEAELLLRHARALRGAALMAGLGTFARAAGELERQARLLDEHATPWTPDLAGAWTNALEILRRLVARAATWGETDDQIALDLAMRLERTVPRTTTAAPRQPPPGTTAPLTPGVRSFLSRETGLIAGALEEAAIAHVAFPPTAALQAVLERIHTLRGLGSAVALSPLPELLDAMELTTRSLLTDAPPPPGVGTVLADAATALAKIARGIGEHGRVVVPPELERVGRRLLHGYASEEDVVPITTLAPAGVDPIALAGRLPLGGEASPPVAIELAGVGDHLLAQAAALANARTAIVRDLRLFVLHRTLATMPTTGGTGRFLAPLAAALAGAIARGAALDDPAAFVGQLRASGEMLAAAGDGRQDVSALVAARDALLPRLAGGGEPALAAPAPDVVPIAALAPDADEAEVVPIAALAPDEDAADIVPIAALAPDDDDDVVPIAALAPDADEAGIVPIAALAPDADDDVVPIADLAPTVPDVAPGPPGRLEAAYRRRAELAREAAPAAPSLGGLLGQPVLGMDDLLYGGEAALARADEVRAELRELLAEPAISLARIRPLVEELLDLVPLARRVA